VSIALAVLACIAAGLLAGTLNGLISERWEVLIVIGAVIVLGVVLDTLESCLLSCLSMKATESGS
jgi:uncharacterized membrane protein YdfJ with MMPL/SSD domain